MHAHPHCAHPNKDNKLKSKEKSDLLISLNRICTTPSRCSTNISLILKGENNGDEKESRLMENLQDGWMVMFSSKHIYTMSLSPPSAWMM
jgi:hypothetical protein